MRYAKKEDVIKESVDWVIIGLYLVMVLCGWLSVYGASYQYGSDVSMFDLSGRAGMQLMWIGVSIFFGFMLLKLDDNIFDVFAYILYGAFMMLLFVTVFAAPDIKGSHSWLVIGPIRLQPAELAKFSVALALARFMNRYNFKLMTTKNMLFISGLILLPMLLIIMQKETGSALVYTAFVLMLYREGLPGLILFLGVCAVVLFVVGLKFSDVMVGFLTQGEIFCLLFIIGICVCLVISYRKDFKTALITGGGTSLVFLIGYLISNTFQVDPRYDILTIACLVGTLLYIAYIAFSHLFKDYFIVILVAVSAILFSMSVSFVFTDIMQPHQQQRIKVSLGMEDDLMGAGYNVNQSKIAIGSGGFWGKGFLNGTQTKLKYVPEQDTDFIFCTVGEEQGFVGSIGVILLFLAMILRLIYLSERQKFVFGRVFGYCVASIFLFHLIINVGMVIGITPVIGIPLPFFSYGGSSLLGFTTLLFIFLRIDMARKRR
ncbi:MAG: rod shape-determining protein RodA [Dysgonamonadaceae bacterium]